MSRQSWRSAVGGTGFPGPIAWMAQHSIAANLLMILLIGGGIWAAFNIQKEVFPEFDLDVVNVTVVYPGAAPSEVEQGILRPVESAGVQVARAPQAAENASRSSRARTHS